MILLDSWAWIEYFSENRKNENVKQIVERGQCYTSAISISEIAKWCAQNDQESQQYLEMLKSHSTILPLDEHLLKNAGTNYPKIRKLSKTIGMLDVIIYTTAQMHGMPLVTGDPDFKNLPNVQMI